MIEVARTVNPRIQTVVRTHSEEEAVLLEKEQAGKVFLGEHELAIGMFQHVLECYAAKAEHANKSSADFGVPKARM
jgi:CPA2 family monovalent cation:H+ antiporter-2